MRSCDEPPLTLGGRRPPNPPDAPHMTHHPDVPRDRSHRRGLASREGVRYIAFSLHGAGTSRWSRGRLEDSPSGLWRTLGKRVGCKPSGVRIPHPPPQFPLRRRLAGNLQPAPPGRPGSDPSEACEHHIGERMAGVAHSAMTYRQRNPGIKRKSESTHHHPESPMCIDPPGCTWEQAPDHNSPWKTPESRGNMAFASYYRFLPCATSDSTHRPTGRAVGKTVRPRSVARSLGHSAKCALVTLAVR